MTLTEIAKLVGGEITGDSRAEIQRVAKIEEAGPGDITFIANLKYKKYLATTAASAVLVAATVHFEELQGRQSPISLVKVVDPYRSFLQLIETFHPPVVPLARGIHPTAVIASSATIGDNIAIGAYVVIGERCAIGNNVTLYPGTILGDDTSVGNETLIYANVTIREQCKIGNRVVLHSGTIVGSDGFGFAPKEDGTFEKIPQRGIVVINDDVEIGANCTIDRATLGETRIEKGVKIDNLVQIAHNVVIGEHTVIAGQSGISGSTKIGKYCMIGGQVGFAGHLTIADHSSFGAKSGVPKSITEEGKTWFGYPIKELHQTLRIEAAVRNLPDALKEIHRLSERVQQLEQQINQLTKESNVK
jgi:UDP-3-O-[3-hydroxymyristoyl] glucosamine N-acyltransferase